MSGEISSVGQLFRRKRREMGLTQSALAREAGCKQSAISMFEAGRGDVLSRTLVERMAEILGIDPASLPGEGRAGITAALVRKYCPVDECPSNIPYAVQGQLCFMPQSILAHGNEKTLCRYCGEILERGCPNPDCHAPVAEAAFCPACGTGYVPATVVPSPTPADWADVQRGRIGDVMRLAGREWRAMEGVAG